MATKIAATASAAEKLQHYRELAEAYQAKHGCRWDEATLAIKRKHPEACDAFNAPRYDANGRRIGR